MQDLKHQNYASTTGSPNLVTGALTDGNQALRLSATDTWVVSDSASSSLAVADGAAGGAALEGWVSFPNFPASTQTILGKVGSYELKITPAKKIEWTLTNGANTVTVTSTATLVKNTWYHVAGVYNGDYTGATQFGNTTQGSLFAGMLGDYYHGSATSGTTYNLRVCKFTAPEKGALTGVVLDMARAGDLSLAQYVRAVVFADNAGSPGALVAQSTDQRLGTGAHGVGGGPANERLWITFPLTGAIYNLPYWLGFEGGESNTTMGYYYENTGGVGAYKRDDRGSDSVDSHPLSETVDPFGTPAGTDLVKPAVYATYTATGRTGDEGKAVLYINGSQDNTAAYAHGIADTANNLQHPAGAAVDLDDWAIYNKKLTPVQVMTHYNAR